MSESMHEPVVGRTTGRYLGELAEPERALELLGDEDVRAILRITGDPTTVSEIVDQFDMPQSTAYRKVGTLEEVGLLEPTNPCATGNTPTRYRRCLPAITLRFDRDSAVRLPRSSG